MSEHSKLLFTSLGLLVIDEINLPGMCLRDILGGAGSYATVGARLFNPPPHTQSVGWMADIGKDIPVAIRNTLNIWGVLLFERPGDGFRAATGSTIYSPDLTTKEFRYTSIVKDITPRDISSTSLLASRTFHLHCPPITVGQYIEDLISSRVDRGFTERPIIVWEPSPSSCNKSNLESCLKAAKLVDVFSPNHLEIGAFFGITDPNDLDEVTLERLADSVRLSGIGVDGSGAIVIRAGHLGCFLASNAVSGRWLPAFYDKKPPEDEHGHQLVVDPTGAGNACLGGMAIGLARSKDIVEAAIYGMVAASFAIEQIGPPRLEFGQCGEEMWNGCDVQERLRQYQSRVLGK